MKTTRLSIDILEVIQIKKCFCKITGGHKFDEKSIVIKHLIDDMMSVSLKCKKCGYSKTMAIPVTRDEWIKNINRVKEYEKNGWIS